MVLHAVLNTLQEMNTSQEGLWPQEHVNHGRVDGAGASEGQHGD